MVLENGLDAVMRRSIDVNARNQVVRTIFGYFIGCVIPIKISKYLYYGTSFQFATLSCHA
jgi:hypothetical protein